MKKRSLPSFCPFFGIFVRLFTMGMKKKQYFCTRNILPDSPKQRSGLELLNTEKLFYN